MQICPQTRLVPTMLFFVLANFFSSTIRGQTSEVNQHSFELKIDSLFQSSQTNSMDEALAQLPNTWVERGNILIQIVENESLRERYKNIDFQAELSKAWNMAQKLDRKGELKKAIETGLVASTIDLYNLGLEAMENARKFKSVGDGEKAEENFKLSLENYKKTGSKQYLVDEIWRNSGVNWKWVRFYRGLSLRLAGKNADAETEYTSLLKLGWDEPIIFLELADLQNSTNKSEEVLKTLQKAHIHFPGNVSIACALTRIYIQLDKLKLGMSLINKFDYQLGSHPELVLTKALVYEKKGDLKKADALFKALYEFDKYEVKTNVSYSAYLMRKAKTADKMDAEEFAQLAFNLIEKASDLSPANDELKIERDAIKFKFPKVYRDEEF